MRYIVLLLVLLVGAGFVFINWPAVNAPAEVNLLITTAKAPITLMLLFCRTDAPEIEQRTTI